MNIQVSGRIVLASDEWHTERLLGWDTEINLKIKRKKIRSWHQPSGALSDLPANKQTSTQLEDILDFVVW